MTIFESIILGLVQGLTEFIPVSSSGHLVIVREVLGIHGADLAVDAVLQLATGVAIIAYFRKDLLKFLRDKVLMKAIILGTIPAIVLGLVLESRMETTFRSTTLVAIMLIIGSLIMYIADKREGGTEPLTPKKGLLIGLFQALALVPGISRSGATISGGLLNGLNREMAAKFSFLLASPIILGSGVKKLLDLGGTGSIDTPLVIGSIVALVSGYFAIRFLMTYLKSHKLTVFIWYRVALAILIVVFI